jgi:glucose-1-phosphate adenylyltransferase
VVVSEGAQVSDSVIFADVRIEAGAAVEWAIVDRESVLGKNARVGGRPSKRPVLAEQLTLVGRASRIGAGESVARGGRLEPGTTL